MKKISILLYSLVFIAFFGISVIFERFTGYDCVFENYISENPYKETEENYRKPTLESGVRIDINSASSEELSALPGIGRKLAERIVLYREENGDFEVIEDIMKIPGVGEKKFGAIKEYIRIN